MIDTNRIFISYKSQERHYALAVRDQLQAWGYETWLDVDNLPPRAEWEDDYDWQEKIDGALKSAAAVVAVVTDAAVHSRYVTAEWDIAIVQNKPLLPLIYEPVALPARFRTLESIQFTGSDPATAVETLRSHLQKSLGFALLISDPFHDYLTALFDQVSVQLGQLMIRTLSTYGTEGRVAGEPIRLTVKTDDNITFEHFDDAFAACNEHAVLLGEAGGGKTIMLLNAVRDAVVARLFDARAPLPIYASIATWDSENASPLEWLRQSSGIPQKVQPIIESGDALLLLDGLDEIAPVQKSLSTGLSDDPRLNFLNALPTKNQILVTCRAQEYASLKGRSSLNRAVTLNPLNDAQTKDYLRDQPEVLAAIESDANLRDLLRTPLLLSFFAFTYERMTNEERYHFHQLRDVGEIRETVFEQFVRRRYQHETQKRGAPLPFELAEIKDVLGQLALEDAAAPFFTNRIHVRSLQALLGERTSAFSELMTQLHLFVSIDTSFSRFVHLLIRDYFAFEPAVVALKDRDSFKRQRAARALKALRDQRALADLIEATRDKDQQVRVEAIGALGQVGGDQAIAALLTALCGRDDITVRAAEDGLRDMARSERSARQAYAALERLSPTTVPVQPTEKWYQLLWRTKDSPAPMWTFPLVLACVITAIIPTSILNNGTAGVLLTSLVYGGIFIVLLFLRERARAEDERRKALVASLQRIVYTLPQNLRETIWWAKGKFK
ncbi:MAG: toll/interleukin-1 receptor domain-containing protein [Anaerolineae bacterium]